jgi:hypothetical protein
LARAEVIKVKEDRINDSISIIEKNDSAPKTSKAVVML